MGRRLTARARFQDRVAIVTGGGQGIGAAIARALVQEGARVAVAEVVPERAERMSSALRSEGARVLGIPTDVGDPRSVAEMVERVANELGVPEVLINNAGIAVFDDPLLLSDEEWRRCFAVDLDGVWHCTKLVLPHMLDLGRGAIVNIASVHSFKIIKGCFPYPVAKHGVVGLTRALALEYAAQHIRINCVCPGYIDTEVNETYWRSFEDPAEERKRVTSLHPVGRLGLPEDVAAAALFLAADESSFITGESLVVDGGRSIVFHD